jgi:plasmid maintenance system antidote protein VapI
LAGSRQQYLQKLADKLGVPTDRLQAAIDATTNELGLPAPPPLGKAMFLVRLSPSSELSAAAGALKLTQEQLRQELPNHSLADVARAHGVDPESVAQAIKAARASELDQAVKEGKLPAEIADKLRAHLDTEAHLLLNAQHAADGSVRIRMTAPKP